jgi:hypothetical protein
MFANIRRHQKWLWYLIAGAVIISFVWWMNPNQQGGGGGGMFNASVGTINGRDISRTEFFEIQKDAALQYFFTYGTWYNSGDEMSRQNEGFMDRAIRSRLLLKDKARELGIHPTPENVADWIRDFFGRGKPFTEAEYNQLLENFKSRGVSEADLNRFARAEVATVHLMQVAGASGRLVTPQEAEEKYRRENRQVSADAVFFSASNYVAKVNMDATNIARHFTNQQQNFRVNEQVQISYVAFPATNHFAEADRVLATVTNLNQQLDQIYMQRGSNYYTDATGLPMTPEAAKAKIKEDERLRIALVEARKVATTFAEDLLNATNATPGKPKSAALDELAQKKNYPVKVSEPFTQYDIPAGMDVPGKFSELVFQLTPEEPFVAEPVVGGEAVYIVALNKRIPSHVPPFAEIQEKVAEDYKRIESQRLAREAGQAFHRNFAAGQAAGKAFNAIAFESGLSVTTLAPFSMTSRTITGLDPRVSPSQVKNAAFALKEGETSQFVATMDGGFVLHVNKFIPVSDTDVKMALPGFIANLQRSGESQAFQEWINREFQGAKLSLVTDRTEGETNSAAQ